MKKLFFAIYFCIGLLEIANAKITPVSGYTHFTPEVVGNKEDSIKEADLEEFTELLDKRFKNARKVSKEHINKTISHSDDGIKKVQQDNNEKNFFQNIYEKALSRISKHSDEYREDMAIKKDLDEIQQKDLNKLLNEQNEKLHNPSIPMVTAFLPPYNTPTEVPAIEHIPYLMNNIEILPGGMVMFEETVVVVANRQKLKSGLTKILPAKITDKKRKTQHIDYTIVDVTLNGEPISYRLAKSNDKVLLVPSSAYNLPAGVYTYKFQYLADNLLLEEGNNYMLYWSVGGNGWNLVVDRSFANIRTPDKQAVIHQEAIVGSSNNFYKNSVSIDADAVSHRYIANIPLFIGSDLHILTKIEKGAFNKATLGQKFVRSFYDYGDIYISLIGFLAIMISFTLSWRYISGGKSKVKVNLNKTSLMIRYILYDKFDKKSICGFLLDLYKKNIIDIQQSGESILLVKKTDNLKGLQSYEKKALKAIFPTHETTFSVTANNKLPLKRFVNALEKGLKKDITKFVFKLNFNYLFFSVAMLVVVWFGIAYFKIDTDYVFGVLSLTSILTFLGALLWYGGKKKWTRLISKYLAINFFVLSLLVYSAVIHPLAALLMIWSIVSIIYSIRLFSRRNGLISSYIKDILKQKEYLLNNKDSVVRSRTFVNNQPLIWACDLEDDIKPNEENKHYKLPIIKNIMARI